MALACSVINAPDDVKDVPAAGGMGGSGGFGAAGGTAGVGGTGVTSTGGTGGGSPTSSGGMGGSTSSAGGAAGSTATDGGAGGSSSGGSTTTSTTTMGAGGDPVTFDEGLVVVSARTAEGEESEQILAILGEDGAELDRETTSVAAIAHDGAADRDVWFIFVAEDIFPLDRTRPADLEVRRFDPEGPGWTNVSQVTALPPPRAGQIAVLNGYVAYLSYRNSDEAETLTILDTRNLESIEQLDAADVPQVPQGTDQSLVGLLGARGSPTNRNAVGGTLNVMIEDCSRAGCPLVVQPIFVGSSVTAGAPVTLEDYNGTPAFASALTERRSFVSMSTVDDDVRLFEFDPFDVSDISDSPVATTTTTMNGLAILECEEALVLSEGDEARLRGVSLTGNVGQGFDLMRPGQELHFEPYTRKLLAPYNQDIAAPAPIEGSGRIDAFTLTGNGVSAPTIEAVAAEDWGPPEDLVPLTLAVRMPPTFTCE
ncbi:MAG TPA: hypothetical protein VFU02_17125 [Polyangiaceae bacterium]|nr:hypothetical protein [Polyangiaceae bacterium]